MKPIRTAIIGFGKIAEDQHVPRSGASSDRVCTTTPPRAALPRRRTPHVQGRSPSDKEMRKKGRPRRAARGLRAAAGR